MLLGLFHTRHKSIPDLNQKSKNSRALSPQDQDQELDVATFPKQNHFVELWVKRTTGPVDYKRR